MKIKERMARRARGFRLEMTRRQFIVGAAATTVLVGLDGKPWMGAGPIRWAEGQTFTPPIGIPAPSFGIAEQAPTYSQANTLHYYVDNTVPGASDASNGGRGTPAVPRLTIPTSLPAGAYCEVHGGTDASPYTISADVPWTFSGTQAQPVILRGVGSGNSRPRVNGNGTQARDMGANGQWFIVDGLRLANMHQHWKFGPANHHACIRNSELFNATQVDQSGQCIAVEGATDVVCYNCQIHDLGDWDNVSANNDWHGMKVVQQSSNVWMLDCTLERIMGDGTQFGDDIGPGGGAANEPFPHHGYVGRCSMRLCLKSPLDTKTARDIVHSQNVCSESYLKDTAAGAPNQHSTAGIATKESGERIWYIFNRFHTLDSGGHFAASDHLNYGRFTKYYVIGNIFHEIGQRTQVLPQAPLLPGNETGSGSAYNSGFECHGTQGEGTTVGDSAVVFANNTFYNCRHGVGNGSPVAATRNHWFANNIVHLAQNTHHTCFEQQSPVILNIRNNLFDPSAAGTVKHITTHGDGVTRTSASLQSAYPSECSGNVDASHGMVSPGTADFNLTAGSAARGIGLNDPGGYRATFQTLYGQNIKVDFNGLALPSSGAWDAGAMQFGVAATPPAAPTNLRIALSRLMRLAALAW